MWSVSHYRVLGIPLGATRVEIRAAYLRAARTAHPDLQKDAGGRTRLQAADRMYAVNEAWRVLGDPSRRRIYDAHRIASAAGAAGPVGRTAGSTAPGAVADPPRPERVPGRAPAGGRGNPLVLVPAALFGLAVLQLVAGLLLGVPTLLATGVVTFALSVAAFAAAPMVMLATTRPGRRPVAG
jgi:hypothetical protein